MVRLSNKNDIDGIIAAWKEAFGDSETDISFFLNAHYIPENTVVYDYNGIIASALFLIEGNMHIKGEDYPSYYLYAACTLKEFRGRGMMAELLEYSRIIASERKKYFIALKPAEESLYNYYSNFGYKAVFSKNIATFDVNPNSSSMQTTLNNDNVNYCKIRDSAFNNTNYFKWNNHSVDFAFKHHNFYGGYIFSNCNGYLLYSVNSDTMYVKENTFPQRELLNSISFLTQKHEVSKIITELPCCFEIDSDMSETIKSGMILALSDDAFNIINHAENCYLALTLD